MPGTVFVAYTDGVSEARNAADEEFGDDALADLIEQVRDESAAQICTRVLDTIREFRGTRQDQDDVTVLVLKAVGLEGLRA